MVATIPLLILVCELARVGSTHLSRFDIYGHSLLT
jgi:hypothetical protein